MKRFRDILVGLAHAPGGGLTSGSRKAALQAKWVAEKIGARITFLHSTYRDEEDHGAHGGVDTSALELLVRDYAQSGIEVDLVVTGERPSLAMIHRVLRRENDLVIVGRRNAEGEEGPPGSVARRLMRACPAPVWVVQPEHDLVHRRVLAATDLTPVGDLATELAAAIARAQGCTLAVLHAWQVPMDLQMEATISPVEARERRREIELSAVRHIQAVLEPLELTKPAEIHVCTDAPSRAILEEVARTDPDLLVLGTVSRTGVAGLLMGNTAERVLDRVTCSELVVKPEGFVSPVTLP